MILFHSTNHLRRTGQAWQKLKPAIRAHVHIQALTSGEICSGEYGMEDTLATAGMKPDFSGERGGNVPTRFLHSYSLIKVTYSDHSDN